MRVVVTGASGLIGSRLCEVLKSRGDEVVALSRSGGDTGERVRWDPVAGPAPAGTLAGADAVVNLAGEPIAQRWTEEAKRKIRDSRVLGTRNLVEGLHAADPRPGVLASASAAGIYGDRGDQPLDESSSKGTDFLATVCTDWEAAAAVAATELGMRVVYVRTGVVLDAAGGALKTMLPPFRLGLGGPIAGGKQYLPWVALDDVVGIYLAAIDGPTWSGPVNAAAPTAATNADFAHALGRALHRPAFAPVPAFVLRARYGEMATIVTSSARMVPRRAQELGYEFKYPRLDGALAAALR
jgi:uncharacterized protein (TIGR01777 family)